ncbi:MAG TPA: tRNA dihydrouridine synthase DusB [Gammaproteobacteria bacterium]|nr:tRNA dihydrouridine synthase DusB [Gammaproteobacteria bacterium]
MQIGQHQLANNIALAPMAGVTDRPFRQLCKQLGAGMAVSEMVASNPALRETRKSRLKAEHRGEVEPRIVQIAGAIPEDLAEAARYNARMGAQIIDINMGCPAKKVCNRMAGSALLVDEPLVRDILHAVVESVDIPVTLKIRTGPDRSRRNAETIAELAQSAGIAALAVHGRTRADAYRGEAEFATIRSLRTGLTLPLFANGDIDTPERAAEVLDYTGADGVMIGRAAQGRPWIFREIVHYLRTGGRRLPPPAIAEVHQWMRAHLENVHRFYGERQGVRIARKHIGWYLRHRPDGEATRRRLVRLEDAASQLAGVDAYFTARRKAAA